jgi:hypothetical protein
VNHEIVTSPIPTGDCAWSFLRVSHDPYTLRKGEAKTSGVERAPSERGNLLKANSIEATILETISRNVATEVMDQTPRRNIFKSTCLQIGKARFEKHYVSDPLFATKFAFWFLRVTREVFFFLRPTQFLAIYE